MPPVKHALLSASSASRWLVCTAAPRFEEGLPESTSEYAEEGRLAHAIGELKVTKKCTPMSTWTYNTRLNKLKKDPLYTPEMDKTTDLYLEHITEQVMAYDTAPTVAVEVQVDFSDYVPEGFGTCDCCIIGGDLLSIVDYKHGKGVEVSADHNPQMMLYALGALEIFDALYDIDTVTMTIYQPRRSNVSTYTVSTAELLEWAETVLKPTAALAFSGEGEFHCGEWCQFCKAKADCRERAKANLALAAYDFAEPPLLTDEEVEEVLAKVDDLVSWANDIKEYALQAAISGKAWNGWKVVEGRSNRKYTDERLVAAAVIAAGHDPYEQKLLGITEMQKTLGKAKFDEILGRFITKPQGKPTLVPMSDKRPAMNTAASDFEN